MASSDPPITSYRDLKVWQEAMVLAEQIYRETGSFPGHEMFGLVAQARRAAVSVCANIAEGHGRESTGSFVQFLRIAQGSLKELETHILIARRVGFLPGAGEARLLESCERLGKMIRALIRSLSKRGSEGVPV